MKLQADLKYSKEHEWIRVEGSRAVIGITDFAQDSLGDIVFVELPSVGESLEVEDTFGVVESVKTASDLYAPVSGKVVEVNEALADSPELVNREPYGQGWMIVVEISDVSQLENLMDAEQYQKMVEEA
ncbi:glycine cleavage system protein GcvH [Desulforamulus aeronauticus]|uniref:Glycine cleavage system H protein n=1 Tax=Desulforamulus aeronauticus DSM 10349 TaxID=1121421 RepID=A0A1M6PN25_9FIRM|nr:glycine cleavage system protein GcvH [Desulforamulus aeronauticus]SHK09312.1 glycine cleavage system H protein [Desulforamulus aeronauticus DSM 10349]